MSEIIYKEIIRLLRQAKHITALTGAGISAESGIPTFREAQTGLWAQYDPEDLATPQAFQRNPRLVWEWYQWRLSLVGQAQPNAGHVALATLEQQVSQLTLITQNVDGLHAMAGSSNVLELHGRLNRYKCFSEGTIISAWEPSHDIPPRCPQCGDYLRPDVVWFGEPLPYDIVYHAFEAAQQGDLLLSIGTSSLVHPAASLPLVALDQGIPVVEINLNATALTPYADFSLRGNAGQILPALVKRAFFT